MEQLAVKLQRSKVYCPAEGQDPAAEAHSSEEPFYSVVPIDFFDDQLRALLFHVLGH